MLKGVFLNKWAVVVHGDEGMAKKVCRGQWLYEQRAGKIYNPFIYLFIYLFSIYLKLTVVDFQAAETCSNVRY